MNVRDLLKLKVELFKLFPDDRLDYLVKNSRFDSFAVNEVVVRCGEEATHWIDGIHEVG